MPQQKKGPNDFSPKKSDGGGRKTPQVYTFLKPELEVFIEGEEKRREPDVEDVCTCDKVCTCNTVRTGQSRCACDTVARCTCETVRACTCDTVMSCRCDTVKTCRCNPQCSCDSHSPGGGGTRVCRCVPVRAH